MLMEEGGSRIWGMGVGGDTWWYCGVKDAWMVLLVLATSFIELTLNVLLKFAIFCSGV